jgi:hypothetical protein
MSIDSNVKEAVNMVNMVNLLLLRGIGLREMPEESKRKQIHAAIPFFMFTKFTSSQGFLRFESGQKPVENEPKRGVRGDRLAIWSIFADLVAGMVFYTSVLIEHLLTLMIVRRSFAMDEIKSGGHGRKIGGQRCELAMPGVNFHF